MCAQGACRRRPAAVCSHARPFAQAARAPSRDMEHVSYLTPASVCLCPPFVNGCARAFFFFHYFFAALAQGVWAGPDGMYEGEYHNDKKNGYVSAAAAAAAAASSVLVDVELRRAARARSRRCARDTKRYDLGVSHASRFSLSPRRAPPFCFSYCRARTRGRTAESTSGTGGTGGSTARYGVIDGGRSSKPPRLPSSL